jgi:hypothetical protein
MPHKQTNKHSGILLSLQRALPTHLEEFLDGPSSGRFQVAVLATLDVRDVRSTPLFGTLAMNGRHRRLNVPVVAVV